MMKHKAWKPKFYNPIAGVVITGDHVGHFHGVMLARMVTGNRSIDDISSTHHAFISNGPIKESMPQDAFKYHCRCLYFADNWEEDDERWNKVYEHEKEAAPENTANHRQKFGVPEDGYNRRWQAMVKFGRLVTVDKSRIAGWYHLPMPVVPETKPIRSGCTLHLLCVTYSDLATYKIFVRDYGGKTDGDLDHINDNTATTQKWVNLYDIMMDPFKGKGHCVTMDYTYMVDIMALIGRHEWLINMVGTENENRTGDGTKEKNKGMKKGNFEYILFQHNDEPLCYAMWSDNNIVRILSNYVLTVRSEERRVST